jgi:AcrR family transcriptional regulator
MKRNQMTSDHARQGTDRPVGDGTTQRRGGRRDGAGRRRRPDVDDLLLDATIELLRRDGYSGLRVEAVAARAGVAKSTLYRRWPSKSTVVAAAIERLYLGHVAVPDTGDLRQDLIALLTNSYEVLIVGPGRIFSDLIRESGGAPDLVQLITETMHARRRFYRQIFNRAIARGDLAPEIDTDLAIDLLVGPLWVRLLVTSQPISKTAVKDIVDSVLDGLARPNERSRAH